MDSADGGIKQDDAEDDEDIGEGFGAFGAIVHADNGENERNNGGHGQDTGHRVFDIAPEDLVPRVTALFFEFVRAILGSAGLDFRKAQAVFLGDGKRLKCFFDVFVFVHSYSLLRYKRSREARCSPFPAAIAA